MSGSGTFDRLLNHGSVTLYCSETCRRVLFPEWQRAYVGQRLSLLVATVTSVQQSVSRSLRVS